MAENPTPTNLNYGPELIPQSDFPTPQTAYPTPAPNPVPAINTPGLGGDPYANIYKDFDRDVAGYTQKQDYMKAGATTAFNAERLLFDKYESTNHGIFSGFFSDFAGKGFIPWRDNEDTYNQDTDFLKEMYRSTKWSAPLFFEGGMSNLRSMVNGMGAMYNSDVDKLFATDDYLAEKWSRATKMGGSTAGGMSTFFTNFQISAANMLGTITEIVAEDYLLAYATAQSGGSAAAVTLPRIGSNFARGFKALYEGFKNIAKVTDIMKDVNTARRAYEVAGGALKGSANFLNPFRQTTEFVQGVRSGDAALGAAQGFGAFYRDIREINFALTEAKLEGGFSYLEQKEDLTQRFVEENGRLPVGEEARLIEENARKSGDFVTKTNLGVVYFSNRLGFGNMFKGFKPLDKLMTESAQGGVFKYIDFNDAKKVFQQSTDKFDINKAFRRGVGISLNYFKANITEGLQENIQEVVGGAAKDYYTKQYDTPAYGGINVMMGDIAAQMDENVFSAKGAETFASGFLMGAVIGGGMKAKSGIQNLSYRYMQPEKYAEFKQQRQGQIDRYVNTLNEVYKDPMKYFSPELMNAARQGELNKYLAQAVANKNEKMFYDIKDQSVYEHLYTMVRSGKTDIFKDKLSEMKQLKPEEFEEALGYKVDKPEDFQSYIDEKIAQIDRIENLYETSQQKLPNPVNISAFKKGTKEYEQAATEFMAFENARQQAIFASYSFIRNGERMLSLLGNMKDVKLMGKSNYLDLSVLSSGTLVAAEVEVLKKEIESLKQGDADSKKLAEEKERRLKVLQIWSSTMNDEAIKPDGKFPKDYPSIDNPAYENWRRAAKLAFADYVNTEAGLQKDFAFREGIDQAFDYIMDYHTLNRENERLVEAMNILADPENFLKLYDGHYGYMQDIYNRRKEAITQSIFKALSITDENDLINKLAKEGFIEDPEKPGTYLKLGGESGISLVEPGSEDAKRIETIVADHNAAIEADKKKQEEEEKKKKEEAEKKKKEAEKKGMGGKQGSKKKKEKDKEEDDEEEEEDLSGDENGTIEVRQDYINPRFEIAARKINYTIKRNADGTVQYIVWNYIGSKKTNVEKQVNDLDELKQVLELRVLIDYLNLIAKSYKADVKYDKAVSSYIGIAPSLFSPTENPLLLQYLSESEETMEYLTTDETIDERFNIQKDDIAGINAERRFSASDIANRLQLRLSEMLAENAERKKVNDKKFILSANNTTKVFAMGKDMIREMRNATQGLSKEDINKGIAVELKKVKQKEPTQEFRETKDGILYRVLRQNPPVESTLKFLGLRLGFPTYHDVYIYEVNGVQKKADELTPAEFSRFANSNVSFDEFIASYNNSKAIYQAFEQALGKKNSIDLSTEDLAEFMDVTPVLGEYAYTKEKYDLVELESESAKLVGIVDRTNAGDIKGAGDTISDINDNRTRTAFLLATVDMEKRFENQGRYIAVFELANGQPAFVEVTSAQLDQAGLDRVFSDMMTRLEETFEKNLETIGGKTVAKNPNFNREFDQFTEDSGRRGFYVALSQDRNNPDAMSYSVRISVTANGSIGINYDNTRTKEKDYNKIFADVVFDKQGRPQIESFDDMLSLINEAIANYNIAEGKDLPLLKPENFKDSISKYANFKELQKQQTNVAPGIFKNPSLHMTFTGTKGVDESTKKTGKEVEETDEESDEAPPPPKKIVGNPFAKIDLKRGRENPELDDDDLKNIGDNKKKNDTGKTIAEIEAEFAAMREAVEKQFVINGVVADIVAFNEALSKVDQQYKQATAPFRKQGRKSRFKITDAQQLTAENIANIEEFKYWVKKNMGDLFTVEELDNLTERLMDNKVLVGRFLSYVDQTEKGPSVRGSIETSKGAAFKYHEAFHGVFTMLLTDEQIDRVLSLARYELNQKFKGTDKTIESEAEKMRGDHPSYAGLTKAEMVERYLEEYLADEFDAFKTNQAKTSNNVLQRMFARFLDFINGILGRKSQLYKFYKDIDTGKYRNNNAQNNRFMRQLEQEDLPVIRRNKIRYGDMAVELLNGETEYVPRYVSESDTERIVATVVNSFIYRAERMPEYNKTQLLDQVLQDLQRLYQQGPRYNNMTLDKVKRLNMFKDIFNSADAREDIKKSADVFLQLMGYGQNLNETEEMESALDDEGDRATTDKYGEKFEQGGFKSFSKYARLYIQSTVFEGQDEFGNKYIDEETGEPMGSGVNAGVVYNGMVKLMSGVTTQEKFIQRLLYYRNSGNVQTKAFINKFLEDTGISAESNYQVTQNQRLFNAIFKPFTLFNVSYRSYIIDPGKKIAKSIRANAKDAATNQYNQWQNDFNYRYQDQLTEAKQREVLQLMADIKSLLVEDVFITEGDIDNTIPKLQRLRDVLGISIAPEYYRYSVYATVRDRKQKMTEDQLAYLATFEGLQPLLGEDLAEIANTLSVKESPFITFDDVEVDNTPKGDSDDIGDEEDDTQDNDQENLSDEESAKQAQLYEQQKNKGNRSRLMRIAEGNAIFDESVLSSSWLNAEFEMVSSFQNPNFHLSHLEDTIKDPAKLKALVEADPFLRSSWIGQQILNNGEFMEVLNRVRIERIDGITARTMSKLEDGKLLVNNKLTVNKRDGIVYGKFKEREFLLTNLLMYLEDMEVFRKPGGKEIVTTRSLIRVIESKNTGDTINMPVVSAVTGTGKRLRLTEEVRDILLQDFMAEHMRIHEVWKDRNNPDKDILEGYNSFNDPNNLSDPANKDNKLRGINYRTFADILGDLMPSLRDKAMSDNPQLTRSERENLLEQFEAYFIKGTEQQDSIVDQFIDQLADAGLVKKLATGKITNKMLPVEIFGSEKNTDRMSRLFLGQDFRSNIAQIFLNDYINTISINKLYYGDQAESLKDFVDAIKRAAGAAANGMNMSSGLIEPELGINHVHLNSAAVTHVDPVYAGQYSGDSKQKQADAQTWSTVKAARYNAFGLGRLDEYKARIFDKLERGESLTAEEIFGVNGTIANNAQLKVEKLVYFDGKTYVKTSVLFLTKEFTSMLRPIAARQIQDLLRKGDIEQAHAMQRDNANWVAIPGKETLHDKRVEMEKYEQENNTTVYSFPESASKMLRKNVSKSLSDFRIQPNQVTTLDNRYMRLQVENTTNKKGGINDSTQMMNIIDTEQDRKLMVEFRGEKVRMGDIIDEYQKTLAQKAKVSFIQTRNSIFDIDDAMMELKLSIQAGKLTPRLATFQKHAMEHSLKQTGATTQLLEFFEVVTDPETGEETPAYDLNHPLTKSKFEQLFLSYFRKNTLSQRVPGQSLTLASGWGIKTMRRATRIIDGRVVEWEYIRENEVKNGSKRFILSSDNNFVPRQEERDVVFYKSSPGEVSEVGQYFVDELRHNVPVYNEAGEIVSYKTEMIMPHHMRETMEELDTYAPVPEALLQNFSVRIPGQDKHSAAATYLIDFAPAVMGSVVFVAKEVLEISGADFDVDKLYTQMADVYIKRNVDGSAEFVKYGSATDDAGRFLEWLTYNFNNNIYLKDKISEIKDSDPEYAKLSTVLTQLYKVKEKLVSQKKTDEQYKMDMEYIDRVLSIMTQRPQLDETEVEDKEKILEYAKLKGNAVEFIRERVFNLNNLHTDLVNELRKDSRNIAVVTKRINQIKREKTLLDRFIQFQALEDMNMPTDVESFLDFESELGGSVNIGEMNNFILESRYLMLVNQYQQQDNRAFEVADITAIAENLEDAELKRHVKKDSSIDNDNLLGKLLGYKNNKEGSRGIGVVVNGQMANTFLMKNKVRFRDRKTNEKGEPLKNPVYILEIDGVNFDYYGDERKSEINSQGEVTLKFTGRRKMNSGSAYITVMTDNAKERIAAKFNLNSTAASIAMDMVGRGVPEKLILAMMLNPAVEQYFKRVKEEGYAVSGSGAKMSRKKIAAEIMENLVKQAGKNAQVLPLTSRLLLEGLDNPTPQSGLSVFSYFLKLEAQSRAHGTLAQILKLTKGPTANFSDWDALADDAYEDLGIGMTDAQFAKSDIPWDVRELVTKRDPLVAAYWQMNRELHDELGKTVMISRSNLFKSTVEATMSQLNVNWSLQDKVKARLGNNVIVYFALRGYLNELKRRGDEMVDLLDNNLVYGTEKDVEDISDIILEARRNNPDNFLINKYLRLVPRQLMQGGKLVNNKDNKSRVNIIEPSTYGTTDPYMLSKIHASYIDLLQKDRKAALALFAYSMVKDATLFTTNGIMHIFPTFMFKELIGEIMFDVRNIFRKDDLTEYLSQGRNARAFNMMFGGSFKKVVGDFLSGYLTHVETKTHLKDFRISMKAPEDKSAPRPMRFTIDPATDRISRSTIVIDLFDGVKPAKTKYKKKKQQDDDVDQEENVESPTLDRKNKDRLIANIKALRDSYKIFIESDNEGALGMVLPYAFKVKRNGVPDDVYVLQNISRVNSKAEMENAELEDRLTNSFKIVAPRAVYKRVDSSGSFGTTPIGSLFGQLPDYQDLTKDDVVAEKQTKKSLSSRRNTQESDLDIGSPDSESEERPEEQDDETISKGIAYKRDVIFLQNKGISVTISNGKFVYKRNGKAYNFIGNPADLAEMIDSEIDVTQGKKSKTKSAPKNRPVNATAKKKTIISQGAGKVKLVANEDITQEMVDEALEDNILNQSIYDGKSFVASRKGAEKTFGTYKTAVPGMSALQLIAAGTMTEITVGRSQPRYALNQLFIIEDTNQNSPTNGKQIMVRAVSALYTPKASTYIKFSGWDESVWENRKAELLRKDSGYDSFRIEYVGEIKNGELYLQGQDDPQQAEEKPVEKPAAESPISKFSAMFSRDAIAKARQSSAKDAASDPEAMKEMNNRECKKNK